MRPKRHATSLVYSTELGRTCPECRQAMGACRCSGDASRIVGNGNVRVAREVKGRGGKVVTLVSGLALTADELAVLATQLKKRCGSGGTVKDGIIEIQGDHRDLVVGHLTTLGHRARKSG